MTIPFIAALLLFGSLTAAQDDHISNFQVANKNSTHITFSWDIVDGYYTSSYISYFYLYYQRRSSSYTPYVHISYSSATRSGTTFRYTRSLENFNNGSYIMWVRAYRPSLDTRYTYSGKKYVKTGQVETNDTILELKVHLHPTLTCSEFLLRTYVGSSEAIREVEWFIHETCQCTLPYDFSVQDGYFTCTAIDYVVFRAKMSMSFDSSSTVDMASLKANLSNFFTRQNERTPITMNGGRYFIEPGPCGLTVLQFNSPHCLDSSPTQQASAAVSTPPQDSNVTTIVAVMSVSLAVVVLGGCIVYLVIGLRIVNHRRTKTAEVKAPRLRDLEMTSEVRSRNIPPSCAEEHVYASSDIPIQRNPRYTYGMTK